MIFFRTESVAFFERIPNLIGQNAYQQTSPVRIALLLYSLIVSSIAGFLAASLMTVCRDTRSWKKWGISGVAEWQVNQVIIGNIFGKSAVRYSIVSHLFHGTILGIMFKFIILYVFPETGILIIAESLVFSMVLWIIAPLLTRRVFENVGGIKITEIGLTSSFISHLVFGLALEPCCSFDLSEEDFSRSPMIPVSDQQLIEIDGTAPENMHFKWTKNNKPIATIPQNQSVRFNIPDCFANQLSDNATLEDLEEIDPRRWTELVVQSGLMAPNQEIRWKWKYEDVKSGRWGWSMTENSLGLLKNRFPDNFTVWDLRDGFAESRSRLFERDSASNETISGNHGSCPGRRRIWNARPSGVWRKH